jgi:putative membrane protein
LKIIIHNHKKMKFIMKKITLSSLVVASMLLFSACSNNKSDDTKEVAEEQNEQKLDDTNLEDDSEFAVAAADGGMMEVQLGELAQTNGASADVKKFGEMMVKDHSKANEELKALAQQKNITLPMTLSDDKQKKYDDLSQKKGADFDKAYVSYMVDDHKKDISEFEEAVKDAKDAEIKSWAAGKVPTLKHHLETAQALNDAKK